MSKKALPVVTATIIALAMVATATAVTFDWWNPFGFITGKAIDIEDNTTEYPEPITLETETEKGKKIVISSDIHYTNVSAHTWLLQEVEAPAVKLYHVVNGSRQEINVTKYDTNNNSLIDYIEWTVPGLSKKVYELEVNNASGKVKSYGKNWDRLCEGGGCNLILYSGIKNVKEDGHWKTVEEARSLKGKGFSVVYLENDSDFPLEVVDFNYTSIVFNVSVTKDEDLNKDIELKIKERSSDGEFVGSGIQGEAIPEFKT